MIKASINGLVREDGAIEITAQDGEKWCFSLAVFPKMELAPGDEVILELRKR